MAEHTPTRWYQWLLLYPALAASLWAGVPSIIEKVQAWRVGVQQANYTSYQLQKRLWQRNIACLSKSAAYTVALGEGSEVGVTLCKTGDALLRYTADEDQTVYTWVAYPGRHVPQHKDAIWVDTPRKQAVVYGLHTCVSMQSVVVLDVVHQLPGHPGVCRLEVVWIATGKVSDHRLVNCESFCADS